MAKRNKKLFYWVLAILILGAGVVGYKFLFPEKQFSSSIEINEKQKELINGALIVRKLDKEMIEQKIEQGKEYLFKMIDKEENGVHKYYYALNDTFENRLHTTYTSTLTFTLLELYDLEKDDLLLNQALKCAEFILSMQNKEKGSKGYGAFYYSYYLGNKEKEKKFVVGTTSKTIYTLLKLYKLTDNRKYLESAELAADWLTTMQKANGSMKSYIRYNEEGKWVHDTKESIPEFIRLPATKNITKRQKRLLNTLLKSMKTQEEIIL